MQKGVATMAIANTDCKNKKEGIIALFFISSFVRKNTFHRIELFVSFNF